MSEAEVREALKPKKLCPPGQRRGTVLEATEGISPKGNETLRVVIGVTGPDGIEYRLVDVMSATPLGALKLGHFCYACDAEAAFDAGHNRRRAIYWPRGHGNRCGGTEKRFPAASGDFGLRTDCWCGRHTAARGGSS